VNGYVATRRICNSIVKINVLNRWRLRERGNKAG
jgi:hypothetical protein